MTEVVDAAAGCLADALEVARARNKRQADELDQQAAKKDAGTAADVGATGPMETEVPDVGHDKGLTSAFGNEFRRQQVQGVEGAREDDRCRLAAEALTDAFHDSIANHALERLHATLMGQKPGDRSRSSRRSGMTVDDDMDDEGPEADREPVAETAEVRREVTRVVTGAALRLASAASENVDREPKAVVRDEVRGEGTGTVQANAARVRSGLVAILRAQYNLYCDAAIPDDQKRRIMTYPNISKENGERLCGFLDLTDHHELVSGSEFQRVVKKYGARYSEGEPDEVVESSDGTQKVAAAPRVYAYRADGRGGQEKITLYPFVDPETQEFDFHRESRVSLWGYNPKSTQLTDDPDEDVRPAPREELQDEDLNQLALYVDDVRGSMAFEVKQYSRALEDLERRRDMRCQRLVNMGCRILRNRFDGPRADVVVEPPLYVLLNLCGTFFDNIDVMWALIRRGMAEVRPSERRGKHCPTCKLDWKSNPSDCRVCVCEMTNTIVHVPCWKKHLREQTWEFICRGLTGISHDWLDFMNF